MSENTPTPTASHVLVGDLHWLEYAIADYVAKWGGHLTGRPYLGEFGPNIAGLPTSVANMAMTVIRKNLDADASERLRVLEVIRQRVSDGWIPGRYADGAETRTWWVTAGDVFESDDMEPGVSGVLWPDEETQ